MSSKILFYSNLYLFFVVWLFFAIFSPIKKRQVLFASIYYEFGHAALERCQNDDICGTFIYFYTHLSRGGNRAGGGSEALLNSFSVSSLLLLLLSLCRVPLVYCQKLIINSYLLQLLPNYVCVCVCVCDTYSFTLHTRQLPAPLAICLPLGGAAKSTYRNQHNHHFTIMKSHNNNYFLLCSYAYFCCCWFCCCAVLKRELPRCLALCHKHQ